MWDEKTDLKNLPQSPEIRGRVSRLQGQLQKLELDAAWIIQPVDLYYFARTAQFGLMVVSAQGDPGLWIRKNVDRARSESCFPVDKLPSYSKWRETFESRGFSFHRVGLEMDVLPTAEYLAMQRAFPETEFSNVSIPIRRMRQVKSPHEQACVRRAGQCLVRAFSELSQRLKVGMSEGEITAILETVLRHAGDPGIMRVRTWRADLSPVVVSAGSSAAFPVAFDGPVGYQGAHAGLPVGPGTGRFFKSEPLMVDIVASAGGYFADATRVFVASPCPSKWTQRQAFIKELMAWIESQLIPGSVPADIFTGAVARAEEAGFGDAFMGHAANQVRFIGHGVGLEIDEFPVFFGRETEPLRAGMTVAIEPKIIFEDGGVGIENTYLIRENGPPENLTPFGEGLIILDGEC